eukprot:TRINITY_DN768_c0_g1_i3.p1 TRINITY_DN768_c0_g1~~TRINITY_DN768_c0_g1_i3.p1  ORF type:complete len:369 (+),score=87.37 TRINITY_DN768_c0_g1_i3:819-1925(+)
MFKSPHNIVLVETLHRTRTIISHRLNQQDDLSPKEMLEMGKNWEEWNWLKEYDLVYVDAQNVPAALALINNLPKTFGPSDVLKTIPVFVDVDAVKEDLVKLLTVTDYLCISPGQLKELTKKEEALVGCSLLFNSFSTLRLIFIRCEDGSSFVMSPLSHPLPFASPSQDPSFSDSESSEKSPSDLLRPLSLDDGNNQHQTKLEGMKIEETSKIRVESLFNLKNILPSSAEKGSEATAIYVSEANKCYHVVFCTPYSSPPYLNATAIEHAFSAGLVYYLLHSYNEPGSLNVDHARDSRNNLSGHKRKATSPRKEEELIEELRKMSMGKMIRLGNYLASIVGDKLDARKYFPRKEDVPANLLSFSALPRTP